MGWFGTIFMAVFWILILVGLIFFIRWLVQNTKRDSGGATGTSSRAFDILKERYALGEINKDEYEEMKEALQS
ncbi:SHOCT domain-containing protein [Thermodesulfobacteriota bacterium]